MDNTEKDEKFVKIINEHWIKYVHSVFVALLLTGLAFLLLFIWWMAERDSASLFVNLLYITAFILILIVHHWMFLIMFSEATSGVILTNKRLIYIRQLLYFSQSMQDISYSQIKSVRAQTNGLLRNLLHYGDLVFDPAMFIPLVPHPNTVVKEIEQIMGMR